MSDHAVFLIHGLWGNNRHYWYVEQQLKQAHPGLKVHACAFNEGYKTYDGVDVGGDRIISEVTRYEVPEMTVDRRDACQMETGGPFDHQVLDRGILFGFMHHPLIRLIIGGLISRYVIGLLYARGVFETIQPVNFTTFASPHLGVRYVDSGAFYTLLYLFGSKLLSSTGRQLFIEDRTIKPLLLRMADKSMPAQKL